LGKILDIIWEKKLEIIVFISAKGSIKSKFQEWHDLTKEVEMEVIRQGPLFIDAHIHLADPDYEHRVERVLEIARKENVVALVANSMNLKTSGVSVRLAISNPALVYAAVGIHPWNAQRVEFDEFGGIEVLVRQKRNQILAIGEIGLDKSYAKTPDNFAEQRRFFEKQLSLAEETNLPVIVHSRSCSREVLDTLSSYNSKRVLMHWYSGPLEYVKEMCDKGWMLSFGPSIFYSKTIREIMSKIPVVSLLTETDGPVAYRGPFEGRETTPEFIRLVVEEIARILNSDHQTVADQILENFYRFFGVRRELG
jgi:TatD DNase family protein